MAEIARKMEQMDVKETIPGRSNLKTLEENEVNMTEKQEEEDFDEECEGGMMLIPKSGYSKYYDEDEECDGMMLIPKSGPKERYFDEDEEEDDDDDGVYDYLPDVFEVEEEKEEERKEKKKKKRFLLDYDDDGCWVCASKFGISRPKDENPAPLPTCKPPPTPRLVV